MKRFKSVLQVVDSLNAMLMLKNKNACFATQRINGRVFGSVTRHYLTHYECKFKALGLRLRNL